MSKKDDDRDKYGLGWTKKKYTSNGDMTQKRRGDIFGDGAVQLDKLSRGIVEDDDDKEQLFAQKWKEFATGAGITTDEYDNILDLNQDRFEDMRNRFQVIMKRNDEFLSQLGYLLKPFVVGELMEEGNEKLMRYCNKAGFFSFAYFLKQLNIMNQAAKGNLNKEK